MSILVDEDTRVVVQGITGREGTFHTKRMLEYGTVVAAGVTPGKGGSEVEGVPVFNTVKQAAEEEGVNVSCIFVPPLFAADAIIDAASAKVISADACTMRSRSTSKSSVEAKSREISIKRK